MQNLRNISKTLVVVVFCYIEKTDISRYNIFTEALLNFIRLRGKYVYRNNNKKVTP